MIGVATVLVAIVGGVVAGGAAHELVHYTVAKACGLRASIRRPVLRDGELRPVVAVRWERSWRRPVVALAPVVTGLGAFPLLASLFYIPAIDAAIAAPPAPVLGGGVAAWTWLTKPSLADLRVARGRPLEVTPNVD